MKIAALLIAASLIPALHAQQPGPLTLTSHIALPGVNGRIDHLSVDIANHRLFVAAVGNNTVEVLDVNSGKRLHTLTGLDEPQGVFYDAATNRLFVACGGNGAVRVFDATTFQSIATVKFPDDADNLRYDSHTHSVIVGYAGAKQLRNRDGGAGGLGFIDSDLKKSADIVIDAHPESFRVDSQGARIFVNVPDKKEIEVVDAAKHAVVARWPVTAENNFPMALDETDHLLFVGAWKPASLLVFDTNSGKQIASAEIAGKTDDLYYDAARHRIYVLTSVGVLHVFQQKDPYHYEPLARYPTSTGTQTGLYVPEWNKLFAAVPKQPQADAEIRIYEAN